MVEEVPKTWYPTEKSCVDDEHNSCSSGRPFDLTHFLLLQLLVDYLFSFFI
jgi:hypothetical protein